MSKASFEGIQKLVKQKNVYMVLGNGPNSQYRDIQTISEILDGILVNIPLKSCFLHFGDFADEENPDIGLVFKLIKQKRQDLQILMIQISEAKTWGVPDFVSYVYWHEDFSKIYKWGAFDDEQIPCSNTKKWLELHVKQPITKVFVFGCGTSTIIDEIMLLKRHNIGFDYFPVERRYAGDGKTLIKSSDSIDDKIGPSHGFL